MIDDPVAFVFPSASDDVDVQPDNVGADDDVADPGEGAESDVNG